MDPLHISESCDRGLFDEWKTAEFLARTLSILSKIPPQRTEGYSSRRKAPSQVPLRVRGDRFIRWQKTTNTQFGFVLHAVFLATTASFGFAVNQASKLSDFPSLVLCLGIICLGTSGSLALLCSWNRLLDFRLTAQIAKVDGRYDLRKTIGFSRTISRCLGERSWRLLKCQLITFGLGVLVVAIARCFAG